MDGQWQAWIYILLQPDYNSHSLSISLSQGGGQKKSFVPRKQEQAVKKKMLKKQSELSSVDVKGTESFLFVWKLSNVPQKAHIQSEAHLS